MTKKDDTSPAAIAAARQAGETLASICARTGLGVWTVRSRARAAGFIEKGRVRRPGIDPLLQRLRAALERQIAIVEARIASGEGVSRMDSEREARTMNGLARMLDRLNEIGRRMTGKSADRKATVSDDETERLRRTLAERLEKLRSQKG